MIELEQLRICASQADKNLDIVSRSWNGLSDTGPRRWWTESNAVQFRRFCRVCLCSRLVIGWSINLRLRLSFSALKVTVALHARNEFQGFHWAEQMSSVPAFVQKQTDRSYLLILPQQLDIKKKSSSSIASLHIENAKDCKQTCMLVGILDPGTSRIPTRINGCPTDEVHTQKRIDILDAKLWSIPNVIHINYTNGMDDMLKSTPTSLYIHFLQRSADAREEY